MPANAAPSASADAGVHWRRVRGGSPRSAAADQPCGLMHSVLRSRAFGVFSRRCWRSLFGEFTDRGQASSQATGYET